MSNNENNAQSSASEDSGFQSFMGKVKDAKVTEKQKKLADKGFVGSLKKNPTSLSTDCERILELLSFVSIEAAKEHRIETMSVTHVGNRTGLTMTSKQDNELEVHDFQQGFSSIAAFQNYTAYSAEQVRKAAMHIWSSLGLSTRDMSVRSDVRFRDMAALKELGLWLAQNHFYRVEGYLVKFNAQNIPSAIFEMKNTQNVDDLDKAYFNPTEEEEESNFRVGHLQLLFVDDADGQKLLETFRKMVSNAFVDIVENPKVTMVTGVNQSGLDTTTEELSDDIMYASPSFYPWMNGEAPANYIRDFMDSPANVLVLYGVPGTGKSTFCRTAVKQLGLSALITTNQRLMENEFFVKYLGVKMSGAEGQYDVLIAEDADAMLGKRTEGNPIMSQLLNSTDGIAQKSRFKLILTTNLTDLNQVDPALLRPGRCFDAMEFGFLSNEEARAARADAKKPPIDLTGKHYTLAQALNLDTNRIQPLTGMDGNSSEIVMARYPLRARNRKS